MTRFFSISKLVFSSLLAALVFCAAAGAQEHCSNIETAQGPVDGREILGGRMCEYLGIPYAASPVDELRFAAPQPAEFRDETFEADSFGDMCMQYPLSLFEPPELSGSEDCLTLNIWRRTEPLERKLPVMVFVHGGGFKFGSSSEELYVGTKLAGIGGVVVVSFNYRLGPLGFFGHPALEEEEHLGNFGLLDQIAALKWVRENIEAFGGDPENITIFGESAGGMSVGLMLVNPGTDGLFNRAVIESGPMVRFGHSREKAAEITLDMAEEFGCVDGDVEQCLREVPAEKFFDFVNPGFSMGPASDGEDGRRTYNFRPVIDGKVVPDNILSELREGSFNRDVKLIMGFNSDEASLFTMTMQIETEEKYRQKVREALEQRGHEFGVGVEVLEEIMTLYPAEDYETPEKAYIDLVSDMAFGCPAVIAADTMTGFDAELYLYEFGKSPSNLNIGKDLGAFHAVEVMYIFSNFKYLGFDIESKSNKEFARRVLRLWASFAHSGTPSGGDFPQWPKYEPDSKSYLYINDAAEVRSDYKARQCDFFDRILQND